MKLAPGQTVLYRDQGFHRSVDGSITPFPLAGLRIPLETTVEVEACRDTIIPLVGRLPVWAACCDQLIEEILKDSVAGKRRNFEPLACDPPSIPPSAAHQLTIVAHGRDETAAHLFWRARQRNLSTSFIDLTYLFSTRCSDEQFEVLLHAAADAPIVFTRPLRATLPGVAADLAEARHAKLVRVLQSRRHPTLNPPAAGNTNVSKSAHVAYLGLQGLQMPATLVTNEVEAALAFWRDYSDVIYKSGSWTRSLTRRLSEDDIRRLDTLAKCPVLFQENVDGPDARIHTILDSALGVSIRSASSDYRFERHRNRYEAMRLDEELTSNLISVAKQANLGLSGCDLKWNTNAKQWVMLEMNRMPAIETFDHVGANEVANAIVTALASRERAY